MGVPQIIHFSGIFHYKPSILGYPHLWKPSYRWMHIQKWWQQGPNDASRRGNSMGGDLAKKKSTTNSSMILSHKLRILLMDLSKVFPAFCVFIDDFPQQCLVFGDFLGVLVGFPRL